MTHHWNHDVDVEAAKKVAREAARRVSTLRHELTEDIREVTAEELAQAEAKAEHAGLRLRGQQKRAERKRQAEQRAARRAHAEKIEAYGTGRIEEAAEELRQAQAHLAKFAELTAGFNADVREFVQEARRLDAPEVGRDVDPADGLALTAGVLRAGSVHVKRADGKAALEALLTDVHRTLGGTPGKAPHADVDKTLERFRTDAVRPVDQRNGVPHLDEDGNVVHRRVELGPVQQVVQKLRPKR